VFVSIDYGSLELCSVAQQIFNNCGYSTHLTQINSGAEPTDLHSFLGVKIYNEYKDHDMSYEEFVQKLKDGDKEIKNFRTLAKPVGLGFPGGLGPKTMVEFAAITYGVKLSIAEATRLKTIFYNTYPDFAKFMQKTSEKYKTGRRRCDGGGKYSDEYTYTIGSRTRTGCTFTNFANGYLMQSLSSDGAKIALYDTYKFLFGKSQGAIVNFIHDEIIFELKDGLLLEKNTEELSYIMIRAMQKVMPNIRITVEASIMTDRWSKDGPFKFNKKYWLDGVKVDAKQC
jgi:DNA polymerase I-like protein with 3'-5' exonuclease and polymerase domains